MLTVENIKKAIEGTDFWEYGIRVDSGVRYNVGEIANSSRQLFQDPEFDENGNLIYPCIEEGLNKGLYDAGDLGGTSTIGFNPDDDLSIQKAIDRIGIYSGEYIHILGGEYGEEGNDRGEIIIKRAEVIGVYEK